MLKILSIVVFQISLFVFLNFISKKLNLLDFPNERKIHLKPTSYLGGLNILITLIFSMYFLELSDHFISKILIYGSLIALIGLLDDIRPIKPIIKLILQLFTIFYFINTYSFYLNDLGTYEFIGKIYLGNFGLIFTVLCCLLLINAVNYIDGIDLITSLNFIFIVTIYIFLAHLNNITELRNILSVIIIPLIIFLFFNNGILDMKFFLGDSGSNYIGFIISFISIGMYTIYDFHPVLIIWPLSFLVYEFLSTNILRLLKKKYITEPGLDHIHFEIKNKFSLGLYETNVVILLLNMFLTIFGLILFYKANSLISFILFIIIFLFYFALRFRLSKY